jgi:hypothetical protein
MRRDGNDRFFDEVTGGMSSGTSLVSGSTIDMQILKDLFGYVAEAAEVLGSHQEFRTRVLDTRGRLAPMQSARAETCRNGSRIGGAGEEPPSYL